MKKNISDKMKDVLKFVHANKHVYPGSVDFRLHLEARFLETDDSSPEELQFNITLMGECYDQTDVPLESSWGKTPFECFSDIINEVKTTIEYKKDSPSIKIGGVEYAPVDDSEYIVRDGKAYKKV